MTLISQYIRRFASVTIIPVTFLALVFVSGCSDRGTNAPSYVTEEWGLIPRVGSNQIFDFPGLYFQPQNPTGLLLMTAYMPKTSFAAPTGTGRKVPLLVLLAPQFASQDFYFNTGALFDLAQEMTLNGEIEPMAIVCVGNNPSFGGFFYGKSIIGGNYDSVFSQQFIDAMINFKGYNIRTERDKHGIAGIGMGAYGAYRQAMVNSAVWGSVSAADGPLDFDGADGVSGLVPLFDSVVAKFPGDPNTFYKRFDTSSVDRIRSLIVSGAMAFSPADTGMVVPTNLRDSTVIAGVLSRKFLLVRNRQLVTDSATLVDSFFRPASSNFSTPTLNVTYSLTGIPYFNILLPFEPDGDPYGPIWNMWLNNNLPNIHTRLGTPLSGTQMFLASSDNALYNFGTMTRSWASTVKTAYPTAGQVQTYEYGGYEGNPATGNQYTTDILRKMLLFHNEAFKD